MAPMLTFREQERADLRARIRALSEEGLSQSEISRRANCSRWLVKDMLGEMGYGQRPKRSRPGRPDPKPRERKPETGVRTQGGQIRSTCYLSPEEMALLIAEAELQRTSASKIQAMALRLYLSCCQSLREGWTDQPIRGFRSMFPQGHPLAER
jgi:hypothetical protein